MRIAIDIRSLQDPYRSGVGVYTEELLRAMLPLHHEWLLFANAFRDPRLPHFDVPLVRRHFPNRPLNLWMQAFGRPTLDRLLATPLLSSPRRGEEDHKSILPLTEGEIEGVDVFWMPNLKFGTVSKNISLVVTVHDLAFAFAPEFWSFRGRWSHKLLRPRRILERADRIIAVSHATKSDLVQLYGLPAEKITVIYPGPGRVGRGFIPRHAPEGEAGNKFPPYDRDIVFLGTVEPRKNIPGLIRAFGLIADKYPESRLIVAGFRGWGEAEVNWECGMRNAECRKRIVRIPNVDDKARAELLARAAVFAYPSFYEGFGFPVLEAMAAGVPVVAGNLGALPEVVGTAGLLADPDDPRSIATALDAVLGDEALASRLRARGLERVKDFSWERCAEETMEVLKHAT